MIKKILLILTLCIVLVVGLVACGKNKNGLSNNVETNKVMNSEETLVGSEEYQFIFDYYKLTDEWWKNKNDEGTIGDFIMTNRDVFKVNSSRELGNIDGKLSVRPIDFQVPITVNDTNNNEYYIMKLSNNKFIFPQNLTKLDNHENDESSIMTMFLLDNKLMPYKFHISIEKIPNKVPNKIGEWVKLYEKPKRNNTDIDISEINIFGENNSGEYIKLYYLLNEQYCLSLSTNSNIYIKNANMTAGYEDIDKFTENLIKTISIHKVEEKDAVIKIFEEDIKLDNKTTIHVKDRIIEYWSSGAASITEDLFEKDNEMSILNKEGNIINIREYDKSKDIDELLTRREIKKEEFDYKGNKVYLCKHNNSVQNEYSSFMFEINGTWYDVGYKYDVQKDVSDINIWINNMINGVIVFYN